MVRFWEDTKDIKITIGETLSHISRRVDLVGWVRTTAQADMPALADEIVRLSKENAQLRSQLADKMANESINGLSFQELNSILESKDLINELTSKTKDLASFYGVKANSKIYELAVLGLVESHDSMNGYYRLSNAGRVYLNKLAYKNLGQ